MVNQRRKSACSHVILLSSLEITIIASMTAFFASIKTINCRIAPVGEWCTYSIINIY